MVDRRPEKQKGAASRKPTAPTLSNYRRSHANRDWQQQTFTSAVYFWCRLASLTAEETERIRESSIAGIIIPVA